MQQTRQVPVALPGRIVAVFLIQMELVSVVIRMQGKKGCSIESFLPYAVNASEAAHVQVALRVAKKYNIRFNVKNTGHKPEKWFVRPRYILTSIDIS